MSQERNPFDLLAYLLYGVRRSLEDEEEPGRAPRWIRIVRGRELSMEEGNPIGPIIQGTVNGFIETISYLQEFVLDVRDILVGVDAFKSMVEVVGSLAKTLANPGFRQSLAYVLHNPTDSSNPQPLDMKAGDILDVLEDVENWLNVIPRPDDIARLGHEIYRLLCITQHRYPLDADRHDVDGALFNVSLDEHVIIEKCGKLRLLAWAYDEKLTQRGLGPGEDKEVELERFGSRRLTSDVSPEVSHGFYTGSSIPEEVFNFDFTAEGKQTVDIEEAWKILKELKYVDAEGAAIDDTFTDALHVFQAVNELPETRRLDNHAVNRMLNLDFATKNLKRAEAFDEARHNSLTTMAEARRGGTLPIRNSDADDPEEEIQASNEQLRLLEDRPGYAYYVIEATKKLGWLADDDAAVMGFVALQSRRRAISEEEEGADDATGADITGDIGFDGGVFTEGESASGTHFWAARHVEPWTAGRVGDPGDDALLDGEEPPNKPETMNTDPPQDRRSRIYQWVNLKPLMDKLTAVNGGDDTFVMYLWAESLIRSMWQERSTAFGRPDRGRLIVELYEASEFDPAAESAFGNTRARYGPLTVYNATPQKAQSYVVESPYYPDRTGSTSEFTPGEIRRTWLWQPIHTEKRRITPDEPLTAAMIVLEGVWQAATEIDVYFDAIRIRWDIRKENPAE